MSIVAETYVTLVEADTINSPEVAPWEDTEDAAKQEAIEWATVYMDSMYVIELDDGVSTTDVLRTSNALLANEYLKGGMFDQHSGAGLGVVAEEVKAGSVMTKTEYNASIATGWVDPYVYVTALMSTEGYGTQQGGASSPQLVRT